MINKTPATTVLERSVRISSLAHEANPLDLQALIELGARRAEELNGTASGPDFDAGVLSLAAAVTETFEPEVPAFEIEEQVIVLDRDWVPAPRVEGRIVERYLNERGGWEYRVRIKGCEGTYAEAEIAPFNG